MSRTAVVRVLLTDEEKAILRNSVPPGERLSAYARRILLQLADSGFIVGSQRDS